MQKWPTEVIATEKLPIKKWETQFIVSNYAETTGDTLLFFTFFLC